MLFRRLLFNKPNSYYYKLQQPPKLELENIPATTYNVVCLALGNIYLGYTVCNVVVSFALR